MKKIILVFISLFILTGCYDHIELDNLALVSGIGIDYKNNEFILTYEIYDVSKNIEDTTNQSYIIEGSGKSISEAFTNTNYKTGNTAYYSHMNILLISESIAKDHFEEITDYLFRNIYIRDEFILAITKDISPKEILDKSTDNNPVVSEFLAKTINNTKYNNDVGITDTFQDIMKKILSEKQDIILNSIIYKDEEMDLGPSFIFKKYKSVNEITKKDTTIYNILNKNVNEAEYKNKYKNKDFLISITESNSDIEVYSDKIKINLELEAKVIENNPNLNLKDTNTYEMLNKDFSNIIKNDILNFINILQKHKSDILGFEDLYYKKNNKKLNNLWQYAKIDINVNLNINTKGFIFEVER